MHTSVQLIMCCCAYALPARQVALIDFLQGLARTQTQHKKVKNALQKARRVVQSAARYMEQHHLQLMDQLEAAVRGSGTATPSVEGGADGGDESEEEAPQEPVVSVQSLWRPKKKCAYMEPGQLACGRNGPIAKDCPHKMCPSHCALTVINPGQACNKATRRTRTRQSS